MNRIEREKLVVRQMIAIYYQKHHAFNDSILCDDCLDLLNYAHKRLDHCPKGNGKSISVLTIAPKVTASQVAVNARFTVILRLTVKIYVQ